MTINYVDEYMLISYDEVLFRESYSRCFSIHGLEDSLEKDIERIQMYLNKVLDEQSHPSFTEKHKNREVRWEIFIASDDYTPLIFKMLSLFSSHIYELNLFGKKRVLCPDSQEETDALNELSKFSFLKVIDCTAARVSDEFLRAVARVPNLETLDLHRSKGVTCKGISALINSKIEKLGLRACEGVKDKFCKNLPSTIKVLDLGDCVNITAGVLDYIINLEDADEVCVDGTKITENEVDDEISRLKNGSEEEISKGVMLSWAVIFCQPTTTEISVF